MPIYEFCCHKCGEHFEELLPVSSGDSKPPKCPGCGSKQTERLLSGFSFKSAGKVGAAAGSGGCSSCSSSSCSSCG